MKSTIRAVSKLPLLGVCLLVLGVASTAPAETNTWNNASGNLLWDSASANWTLPPTWIDADDAVFGTVGVGAITNDAFITAHNVTFNSAGYSLWATPFTGYFLTLSGTNATIAVNAPNANIPVNVALAGVDGLIVTGTSSASLTLGGDPSLGGTNSGMGGNIYTGGTYIRGGTVVLGVTSANGNGNGNMGTAHAVDSIEALDSGATLKLGTNSDGSVVQNGQFAFLNTEPRLVMSGGTFDLNGDNNQNTIPWPDGFGTIINTHSQRRGVLKLRLVNDTTNEFSGIIKDGGVVTNSAFPNQFQMFVDSAVTRGSGATPVFILSGPNTFSGGYRHANGILRMKGAGKLGTVLSNSPAMLFRTDNPFDLNGTSQEVSGLNGNGPNQKIVNDAVGTCSVLTIGADSVITPANINFPGQIIDNTGAGGVLALFKTGWNTNSLSGALTYSGPTMINRGLLNFAAAPSPNSDIRITTPGRLGLSYTGTQPVPRLYLNGVKQPLGVYDATTSPAFIIGGGSLTVTGAADPSQPSLSFATSGGDLILSWPGCFTFKLQVQTNSLSTGITGTWFDYPGGCCSPVTVPIDHSKGTVFFRLAMAP